MRRQDRLAPVAIALLAGLLVGWLLIGWWLWPVQWTNAWPMDLTPEYRRTYVVGVAYMFEMTNNLERARQAMEGLGTREDQSRALEEAMNASPADIQVLMRLQQALQLPLLPEAARGRRGAGDWLLPLLGSLLAVLLVGIGGFFLLRVTGRLPRRVFARPTADLVTATPAPPSGPTVEVTPVQVSDAEPTPAEEPPAEPPAAVGQLLGTFTPTYRRGTSDYTESFDLKQPDETYIGDCGMGISEALGGSDDRVTALEVWLFDKRDIRTETYVLLSEHAYHDSSVRGRLAHHGQVILAMPGQEFTIESKSLILKGEVLSVEYGDGDVPPRSVFNKVEVLLKAYLKEQASQ